MHSPTVAHPLYLQTHYIRNIAVVSCFNLIFISSGKRHPLWSSFEEKDPYPHGTCIYLRGACLHACVRVRADVCLIHHNFAF